MRRNRTQIWTGYCPQCLAVHNATPGECCPQCKVEYKAVLDEKGALTRDYLLARKVCCENFCRNCPYDFKPKLLNDFKDVPGV